MHSHLHLSVAASHAHGSLLPEHGRVRLGWGLGAGLDFHPRILWHGLRLVHQIAPVPLELSVLFELHECRVASCVLFAALSFLLIEQPVRE